MERKKSENNYVYYFKNDNTFILMIGYFVLHAFGYL